MRTYKEISVYQINKKALRAESHCGGMEFRRKCDPPQAENPARAGFFLVPWGPKIP